MESCLSTERERQIFSELLDTWRENHLATAPREQLRAIERAMYRPAPVAIHREDRPIYHAGVIQREI
jgi:hypothetical protein